MPPELIFAAIVLLSLLLLDQTLGKRIRAESEEEQRLKERWEQMNAKLIDECREEKRRLEDELMRLRAEMEEK